MAFFRYKAQDKSGKVVVGMAEAIDESSAIETLAEKGLSIISLSEEAERKNILSSFFQRVKIKDIVIFSRQFSVMISANVAIVQALKILVEQTTNLKLRMVISEVADEVDNGSRLSDALAKRPKIFSNFYVSVVRSGETSGKLDETLSYLADEMEKDYDMTSKIRGAMIYPIFVLCALAVVGVIMMIFVVPKLTGILTETGAELPIATKILIAVSSFMAGYWWLLIIIFGAAAVGFKAFSARPEGKIIIDALLLKMPIFGRLFQRIYLVRFCRSMNTLIVGGVAIVDSLKIAADIVNNQVYKELIAQTAKEVETGSSISTVFLTSSEIPKMVSQMISIGEKTGKLDVILERITAFYTREINNIVANLMSLMEPVIMVVMGIAVGIMVAAIILPMYNMATQF